MQLSEGAPFVVGAGPSVGHWRIPDELYVPWRKNLLQLGAGGMSRGNKAESHCRSQVDSARR
jgi:hypothetical protein